jgi:hypothetical protein
MRKDMLSRIHGGHLGIEKCRARAREAVYWPGINRDIETLISKCDTCQRHRYKQAKEPMLIPEMPTEPWQKVGTDLFHVNGKDFLLVMDYHSNYPEVAQLNSTSASAVITRMKSIFGRHGIPQIVQSDNGPQYSSQDFQMFAEEYGFQHTTSSPLYPKAIGKAEKGVEIVKRLLKKAAETKSDPYLALLTYRSSPLGSGASPSELLMNRKLRRKSIMTRRPGVSHLSQNTTWSESKSPTHGTEKQWCSKRSVRGRTQSERRMDMYFGGTADAYSGLKRHLESSHTQK